MLTLSYGFKKPETNDKGPIVFPALEGNIQQLNDHKHDGADSAKISAASIAAVSQTVSAAGWVALGGGNYHQQVNLTPGYDFDAVVLSFRNVTTGEYIYPSVTKVSQFIIDITTNDPAVSVAIYYGV